MSLRNVLRVRPDSHIEALRVRAKSLALDPKEVSRRRCLVKTVSAHIESFYAGEQYGPQVETIRSFAIVETNLDGSIPSLTFSMDGRLFVVTFLGSSWVSLSQRLATTLSGTPTSLDAIRVLEATWTEAGLMSVKDGGINLFTLEYLVACYVEV